MAKAKSEFEKRIESEAMAISSPTNNDMKCRDCLLRYPDDVELGNCSRCEAYPDMKPIPVMFNGGDCSEYVKE